MASAEACEAGRNPFAAAGREGNPGGRTAQAPEYWLDMNRRISEKAGGRGMTCGDWSRGAEAPLAEDGISEPFYIRGVRFEYAPGLVRPGVKGHIWRQRDCNNGIFIADGTAGQFFDDGSLGDGYFGFLSRAPETLKRIYLMKTAFLERDGKRTYVF